jgi:hypothetical protein
MSSELDRKDGMTHTKRIGRLPAVVAISVLAIAAFVGVATVVQAVREGSWAAIWAIGWLPAVLVVSLWAPAHDKACGPRLRGLVKR